MIVREARTCAGHETHDGAADDGGGSGYDDNRLFFAQETECT